MASEQAKKPLLIIELNEFNEDLIETTAFQYKLIHLQRAIGLSRTHYVTDDTYDSDYLEPWVQWVSIHTGVPSSQHKIKHLGDIPNLAYPQLWETLSEKNITTGIWGVMNGAKRNSHLTSFFLPDPWTFTEPGHPEELEALLALPRYIAKNYCNLSYSEIAKIIFKLTRFFKNSGVGGAILAKTLGLIFPILQFGPKHFVFISYFEYISTLLFTAYMDKYKPQVGILFLNTLAHLEHHHWTQGKWVATDPILHGLKLMNKLLGILFAKYGDTHHIIMHNGLSQSNTNRDTPWVLYRQKDPARFLQAMDTKPIKVEQLMTHDGHAFFETIEACNHAFDILSSAHIENKKLFIVEKNENAPLKLFYRLDFTDEIDKNTRFTIQNRDYPFFNFFDRIVKRTGKHVPKGTIYSTLPFPDEIHNHEFNKVILDYF